MQYPGPSTPDDRPRTTPRRLGLAVLAAAVGAAGFGTWRGTEAALVFLGCAAATALLIRPVARWAVRRGVLALPGGRDIHGTPTPSGGLALFAPLVAMLLFIAFAGDPRAWGLLAGGSLVFALGLFDDVRGASPRMKIGVQVLAGLLLVTAGFRLPALGIPGIGMLELGAFEIPVLLFWIVLATNAFNLSDGLDGLATSLAIMGLAVLTAAGVPGLLSIALAGSCLGFLHYNLPAARVFLGDSGSLLLGFLIAALTLELPVEANLPLAIAVFAYSLGDVAIVTFRRWIRAKPLFAPDQSHVHHKFLKYLGSPLRALIAVLGVAGVQCAVAVLWPGPVSLTFSGVIWIVVAGLLIRMGNYKTRSILEGRPRMRELHLLRRYVLGTLALADSRERVERVLSHLADASQTCALSVSGLTIRRVRDCWLLHGRERCVIRRVGNAEQACWWRAAPNMEHPVLEQERATILKDALLLAAEKLRRIAPTPAEAADPDTEIVTTADL